MSRAPRMKEINAAKRNKDVKDILARIKTLEYEMAGVKEKLQEFIEVHGQFKNAIEIRKQQ